MPVIDLPSNPSNNELFITQGKAMRYNSDKNKWRQVSTMSSAQVTELEEKTVGVSSMSVTGNTLVIQKSDSSYANVSLASFAGNILTNYSSASQLPLSNLVSGTQVYVTDTDSLFITDGSGWYKIATVNLSPSLSLGVSSISIGSGDSVDVSYTVNEPEDTPYTITASATSNASITVHQANNTITFDTPVQDTTETITITATDGVNTVADTLTMTIQFTFDWSTGVQQAKIVRPFNGRNEDNFGVAVDLSEDGNYAIIGSMQHDRGHVHFWQRTGTTWNYMIMMSRTGGHPNDNRGFGRQVVMSADGTIALAGAYQDDNPSNLMDTGALYIFTRSGSTWSQHAILAPTGGEIVNDMQYAIDFDISDDNNYIAVGAQQSKEIFIYKNDGSNNFIFQQKMMPSNMSGEGYAASLALNGDGSYLVATHSTQNRILVYTRTGTTWSEQTNFTVSGGSNVGRGNHGYGKGISLSTDGATLAVIDINNNSKTPVDGSNAKGGAIFVYTRSGSTWYQQAKIIPSDPVGFNSSPPNIRQLGDGGISLSGDGTILVTGSDEYSTPNSVRTGRAYVYQKGSGFSTTLDGASYDNVYAHLQNNGDANAVGGLNISSNRNGQPTGILFNGDGTKLYVTNLGTNSIHQLNLSSAYDITTASHPNPAVSFSMAGEGSSYISIKWNNDGTKLFALNFFDSNVIEYNLSTPYDITSMSYSGTTFNLSTQISNEASRGMGFASDGSKMFIGTSSGHASKMHMYNLSTPYDLSTGSYSGNYFQRTDAVNGTNNDRGIASIYFDSAGTTMFVLHYAERIRMYSLTVPNDPTTGTVTETYTIDVNSQESQGYDFVFNSDMSKIFFTGHFSDKVHQYSTGGPIVPWDLKKSLTSNDIENNDRFGGASEISGDGSTIMVGAFEEDTQATNAGAVYTFVTS